jgi:hypothetical protein
MAPRRIASLHVVGASDLAPLRAAFPSMAIDDAGVGDLVIDEREWCAADTFADFDAIDRRVEAGQGGLTIAGSVRAALEIATRYQRWFWRRNESSLGARFDAVLEKHRAMHDLGRPLVKADYEHALDTWQWVLRLCAVASLELQLAALLHDIERLESEADVRVEHRAADYQSFKDAHAARGGELAYRLLRRADIDEETSARVREMVARHERRSDAVLSDADALSFFSLNSPGYLAYFGSEQTRRKVAYTLGRLGDEARRALEHVRLCPVIAALVAEVG